MNIVKWKYYSYNFKTMSYDEYELSDIETPVEYTDKLNVEFDTATINIIASNNGNRFPFGLRIAMFVNDVKKKEYIVLQDQVTLIRAIYTNEDKLYSHTISVIESTKYLESRVLPNVSFAYYKPAAIAISDWAGFLAIKDNPTFDYYLTNNITAPTGQQYVSMGTFYGTLDGNGYAISGLIKSYAYGMSYDNITTTNGTAICAGGLFDALSGATIANITFTDLYIMCSLVGSSLASSKDMNYCFGSLFGYADKFSTILNVHIDGRFLLGEWDTDIDTTYTVKFIIGGFGGYSQANISYCSYTNALSTDYTTFSFQNATSNFIVKSAGFVSTLYDNGLSEPYSNITDSCSLANIQFISDESGHQTIAPTYMYIYGFAFGNTKRCYSRGSCTFQNIKLDTTLFSNKTFGDYGTSSDCYVSTLYDVSPSEYQNLFGQAGNATVKTPTQLTQQSTFVDWDFDKVWEITSVLGTNFPPSHRVQTLTDYIGSPVRTYSIKKAIQRLFDIADLRIYNTSTNQEQQPYFKISNELSEQLDEAEYQVCPEFYFKQENLFECLLDIGGYLNAIPYIDNFNELHYLWLNKTNTKFDNNKLLAYNLSQNALDYADQTINFMDNLTSDNQNYNITSNDNPLVTFPANNSYITIRADLANGTRISNDNCLVLLPTNAYSIQHFYIKYLGQVKDAIKYLYTIDQYNLLEDNNTGKGRAIVWKQFDNHIYGFIHQSIEGFLPEYPALMNICSDLFGSSPANLVDLGFQVVYQPVISTVETAIKETIDDYPVRNMSVINQSNNIINSTYSARNQQQKTNMISNLEDGRYYEVETYDEIPEVGTKVDNDRIINQLDVEIYPYCCCFTITTTKNYNRISEYISVNRLKRNYPIPSELLQDSRQHFQEYAVFTDTLPTIKSNSHLTNNGMYAIANSWYSHTYNSTELTKPDVMLIDTGIFPIEFTDNTKLSDKIGTYILTCVPIYSANGISFTIKFDNNVSAGYQSSDYEGSAVVRQLHSVIYTKDGYIDYLKPIITSTSSAYVGNNFPQFITAGAFSKTDYIDFGDDLLEVYKDGREILMFTYENKYVKESNNIFIGERMITSNVMIGGSVSDNYYVMFSKNPINKYQLTMKPDANNIIAYNDAIQFSEIGTTKTYSNEFTYTNDMATTFGTKSDTPYQSYAIVDKDYNIIYGYNKEFTINDVTVADGLKLPTIYISFYNNKYRQLFLSNTEVEDDTNNNNIKFY